MLYDQKWEVEIKSDPFSLESLIAWLEKKRPSGKYNWEDCNGKCLIGIYGKAMKMGEDWHKFHAQLFQQNLLHIAGATPWTFGAALDRARIALKYRR